MTLLGFDHLYEATGSRQLGPRTLDIAYLLIVSILNRNAVRATFFELSFEILHQLDVVLGQVA
jgi:hypothetical protein